jgi:hypothetical protein
MVRVSEKMVDRPSVLLAGLRVFLWSAVFPAGWSLPRLAARERSACEACVVGS